MIPVNIISGFLGSGKTTAIIRLLEQKQPDECWAIVVNEFGKVSIDGQTLQSKSAAGSVFDITGGCICCSARGYLYENLEKIIESKKYNRIVIEPTGLGGIDMVTEIVETKPELKLMPVICLVDVTVIENPRLQMNFIYKNQISKAAWIAFSKSDLIPEKADMDCLIDKFKACFPDKKHLLLAENLRTELLDFEFNDVRQQQIRFMLASDSLITADNFEEKHFEFDSGIRIDSEKLTNFFLEHPSIVRAKGHIPTENGWKLVNFMLSGCIFENCPPKNQGELVIIAEKSDENPFPDFQKKMKALII